MTSAPWRSTVATALTLLAGILSSTSIPASGIGFMHIGGSFEIKSDGTNPAVGEDGRVGVMVMLQGEPAAKAYMRALASAGGKGPVAQSAAGAASRQVVNQLKGRQAAFVDAVRSRHIPHDELFRTQIVLNGVALRVAPADIKHLESLTGVVSVKFLPLERQSNITSVPFIGAPEVWTGAGALGLPFDATGSGVRLGIIDTGIDYQHPDFGGSGKLADYQKNGDRTHINARSAADGGGFYFPTAKVVGGKDFVGDLYNGANNPIPDPNPMDCNGHGTHVAGTAAGLGVKSDGTAFNSVYDPIPDYNGFRIGPGVAPGAQLYALRVFGCGGGTNVLTQAIEWAMDPDGDGDPSDHLDVINMSLGSPLGFPSDVDAVAADTAAEAGVIVVAAAGNDGDAFFTNGSPAAGKHVISVAAIVDSGRPGVLLNETSPAVNEFAASASAFTNPDASTPPSVAGQSGDIVLVNDGSVAPSEGCSAAYVNNVAGKIALIDRGDCAFTDKVTNAQSNGAIAVIVVDNTDNAVAVTMGGTPAVPITIPAISISNLAGALLKVQVGAGGDVTVALNAANAGDTFASFSSRGPVGDFDGSIRLKPDLAAPGLNIPSAQTGVTCNDSVLSSGCITPALGGYIPGGQLLVLSGTSMATPHTAGMMAILRQLYPDASADELKARAMNTAAHDVTVGADGSGARFGARSVGSGRIDVALAASGAITMANDDDTSATSVTFDREPVLPTVSTHNVRISNHSNAQQTVDLEIGDIDAAPGIQFAVAGPASITLQPEADAIVPITMAPTPAQMKRFRDPTIAGTSTLPIPGFGSITLPRTFLNEKSSLLKLSQGGVEVARLPIYAATRPHSSLAGLLSGKLSRASTEADVVMSGIGVCTGTLVASPQGPTCAADLANDELSLVSAFELQLSAPRDDSLPGFANLRYVGVNYVPAPENGDILLFGLSTYGKWTAPTLASYNICIDTDGDGRYDKTLYSTDFGGLMPLLGVGPQTTSDAYLSAIYDSGIVFFEFPLNLFDAHSVDTGQLSNNVMVLGAFAADLGITATSKISYGVAVCPGSDPLCTRFSLPATQCTAPDALASFDGPYTYDIAHPGIDGQGHVLQADLANTKLRLPYDEASLGANGSAGLLLLHHHNTSATNAQVILVDGVFTDGLEAAN